MQSHAAVPVAAYAGASPAVTAILDMIVDDVVAGRVQMQDGRPELELNLAEVRQLEGAGHLTGYTVANPDGRTGVHWTDGGLKAIADALAAAKRNRPAA